MQKCSHPVATELKEMGYFFVSYPKTSIKLFNVYQHLSDNGILKLFVNPDLKPTNGFLKDMFNNPGGEIGRHKGNGIGRQKITVDNVSAKLSTEIITNFLSSRLSSENKSKVNKDELELAFLDMKTTSFVIENIECEDVNELNLKNWLNINQKKLLDIYEEDIRKGKLYIATSLLSSKKISISSELTKKLELLIRLSNSLNLPIKEGTLELSQSMNEQDTSLYIHDRIGIIFAIKLVRLQFSNKNVLTIDNRQDYTIVLSNSIEPDYLKTDLGIISLE